jgi:hypothetical protein
VWGLQIRKKRNPPYTTCYKAIICLPSALKIHQNHKCCRNLCVSVPRCVHDTFPNFWGMPTHWLTSMNIIPDMKLKSANSSCMYVSLCPWASHLTVPASLDPAVGASNNCEHGGGRLWWTSNLPSNV